MEILQVLICLHDLIDLTPVPNGRTRILKKTVAGDGATSTSSNSTAAESLQTAGIAAPQRVVRGLEALAKSGSLDSSSCAPWSGKLNFWDGSKKRFETLPERAMPVPNNWCVRRPEPKLL
eukprot:CAMPEP_0172670494 /NCGR_PEP_ID=MMETSP1074-20121228/10336_1 /TAXON_ID=2916 /ORGANISM="Ceratium fusus, Strain PA161109" /LENGTH=119 /DNA_ID=CAMNT_0013487419 /DNA_START=643 /DNA_END=999 /DNA_ORIENTATION=-